MTSHTFEVSIAESIINDSSKENALLELVAEQLLHWLERSRVNE